jgi:tetratricopeptide (TPR) repeat protein
MPARQRTLEAAIAWSYELLPATEQRVLRRLSVFVGGFDAATAESVAAGDGVEPAAVLPALARVVDASLLVAEQDRYRLLLTVRAFARERLQEAREAHATAERHRDAYLAFAEALSRNMTSAGLAGWLPRGRCEHENLQAALAWSLEQHDGTPTVRLAGCLSLFWFRIGFAKDGRELLERALARAAPTGRALVGRCALAHLAGATGTADLGDAAVALCEAERDDELLSLALCWRAHERIATGRLAHAREDSLRAHAVAARAGSEEGLGFSDQLLGDVLERQGDLVGAHAALARSVARYRKLRAPLDAGYALVDFARVTLACGDADEAVTLAGAAVEDFRHREDPRGRAAACAVLGRAYQRVGEPDRARAVFDETAALSRRWGSVLPDSRQLDEAPEEATGGPRVEALPDERAAAVVRGRREQRHGDPRLAEELR